MSTFECTYREFCDQVLEFRNVMTDKKRTDEEVDHAFKCLALHYLGMNEEEKIETAAMILQATSSEALRRGWSLSSETIGS